MKLFRTVLASLLSMAILTPAIPQVMADTSYTYNFHDPQWMSDADFFGVYDSQHSVWTKQGKINYDSGNALAGMQNVKSAVMQGDYAAAKTAYKEYYIEKVKTFNLNLNGSDSKLGRISSKLFENQLLFNESSAVPVDIFSFSAEKSTVSIDFTSDLKSIMSQPQPKTNLILTALKKDGSSAEISSRSCSTQNERPYVEVVCANGTAKILPTGDTYISAGENANVNYGSEEPLKVEESVTSKNPAGAWQIGVEDTSSEDERLEFADGNTKRTYITFDFSEIKNLGSIKSAALKLTGKNVKTTQNMEIAVFRNADTSIAEGTLTWAKKGSVAHSHYIFNFNGFVDDSGVETIYFARPKNCVSRYIDDTFRIAYLHKYPVNQYAYTKDEYYGYIACKMYGDFIKMRGNTPGSYGTLDTAVRLAYMPEQLCKIINSRYMSDELFCAAAKMIWSQCDYLQYSFRNNSNWGSFQIQGLFTSGAMFNEFYDYDRWVTNEIPCDLQGNPQPGAAPHEAYIANRAPQLSQSVAYRLKWMLESTINSDYGSTEKALGYVNINNNLLIAPLDIAKAYNVDFPYSDEMKQKLVNVERYLRDISGPGNCEIQWGNAGTHKSVFTQYFKKFAEAFNDKSLLYSATLGKEGEKPQYTSVIYPETKVAVMRSGWDVNDYYMHTSYDGKGIHTHTDDLSMIIMAKGKYLLSDQMYGDYASGDGVQQWCESAEAHNIVQIGGTYLSGTGTDQPGTLNNWITNNSYDFFSADKTLTNGTFRRNIYFVRPDYWIVNDYLVPNDNTSSQQYRQLWHMPPEANITVDSSTKKMKSNYDDVNLQIVPAEKTGIEGKILTGKYAGGVTTVYDANYVDYQKSSKGITTYNTVIRPDTPSENAAVDANMITLSDVHDNGASAMEIDITSNGKSSRGVYYIVNDDAQLKKRKIDEYTYDGKMMYVQTDSDGKYEILQVTKGSTLKVNDKLLFLSAETVDDIGISYAGDKIYIETSAAINLENIMLLKQQDTAAVYYNGEMIPFNQTSDCIYFSDLPFTDNIEIISPEHDSSYTGNIVLSAKAGGYIEIFKFLIDGKEVQVFDNPFEGDVCSTTINSADITLGKHKFEVIAVDIFGNAERGFADFYVSRDDKSAVISNLQYSCDGENFISASNGVSEKAKYIKLYLSEALSQSSINDKAVSISINGTVINASTAYSSAENCILLTLSDDMCYASAGASITISKDVKTIDGSTLGRNAQVRFNIIPKNTTLTQAFLVRDKCRLIDSRQIFSGDKICAEAVIMNQTDSDKTVNVFLAFYKGNDLVGLVEECAALTAGENTKVILNNTDTEYEAGMTIKVFAVDDMQTMNPIGNYDFEIAQQANRNVIKFTSGMSDDSVSLSQDADITYETEPDCVVIKGATINASGQTYINFPNEIDSAYTEIKFKYDRNGAEKASRLRLNHRTGNAVASEIILTSNSSATWATGDGNGGTNWNIFKLNENDWNTIRIFFDSKNNTQTAWINGQLIKENQAFRSKTDCMSRWLYFNEGTSNNDSVIKINYVRTW